MKRSFFVSLLIVAAVFGLSAQTEPGKTPTTKKPKMEGPGSKAAANPGPVSSSDHKSGEATAAASAKDEDAKPIDQSSFDTSVKPSDDFFLYANGGWLKRTEIPPDQTRWGSFNQLIERNNDALHEIAEKAAKTSGADPDTKKLADYYASGMDEKIIESMRTKPLQYELRK